MVRWLEVLHKRAGSDLLLVAGAPASIRVDGRVTPLAEAPLSGEEIEDAVLPALPTRARSHYAQERIADAGVAPEFFLIHRRRAASIV